jgi:hypothetical protein
MSISDNRVYGSVGAAISLGTAVASIVGVSVGIGEDASSVGDGVSVGSAVTDGLGFGVSLAGDVSATGETVSEGTGVARAVVAVAVGVLVAVAVGVGLRAFTVELVRGAPPSTVTAFVWARAPAPSPRMGVGPFGAQNGMRTVPLALPEASVFTWPTGTNHHPIFTRMRTASFLANPVSETVTCCPRLTRFGKTLILGLTV